MIVEKRLGEDRCQVRVLHNQLQHDCDNTTHNIMHGIACMSPFTFVRLEGGSGGATERYERPLVTELLRHG
jgi:hypothetical protein